MASRQDVIDTITGNVTVLGSASRATTNSGVTVQLENGNSLERHDIPVWVTQESGSVTGMTQDVFVEYDSGDNEVQAWLGNRIAKDWVAPTPVPESDEMVINYLEGRVTDSNDNLIAFEGINKIQSLGAGKETPVIHFTYDNPGPTDYEYASITLVGGVPKFLPFNTTL